MSSANQLGSASVIGGKLNWSKCLPSAGMASLSGAGTRVNTVPFATATNVLVLYGFSGTSSALDTGLAISWANEGTATAAFTLTSAAGAGDAGKIVWWQVWQNQ